MIVRLGASECPKSGFTTNTAHKDVQEKISWVYVYRVQIRCASCSLTKQLRAEGVRARSDEPMGVRSVQRSDCDWNFGRCACAIRLHDVDAHRGCQSMRKRDTAAAAPYGEG
uniref:Transposase n=1 Tax=Ascaris lumbricoides TaxID=6252 RepID=A0A0M3I256_ASCLU